MILFCVIESPLAIAFLSVVFVIPPVEISVLAPKNAIVSTECMPGKQAKTSNQANGIM
jgi:hypothetical protein